MPEDAIQPWGPASPAQQAIWLNERREAAGTVYHMPFALTFEGVLDRAALLAACDAVVAGHPVLAGAFEERDGLPHVGPAGCAPVVEVADLTAVPPAGREAALAGAVHAGVVRLFDLERGPLLRMTLFVLGPARHVLLVVAHHLVFDGESMELFKRDLAACYLAASAGGRVPARAGGCSAAEHAAREQRRLLAELPAAREFWRERWRDRPEVVLPGAAPLTRDVDAGECVDLLCDAGFRSGLHRAAGAVGVSPFELLVASFAGLLARYGNREPEVTVALGTRTAESAGSIGCFGTELPLAVAVDPDAAFSELAGDVRACLRALYPFRGVPLNRAVTGIRPGAMHTAVSLTYRPHARSVAVPGLRVSAEWLFNHAARGALWVQMLDEEDGVRVLFRYPPRALDRDSVERIADHWRRLLAGAIASPGTSTAALPLLGDTERALVEGPRDRPRSACRATVLDLLAARVAERPDGIAAVCGAERATCERLASEAEGLAGRLLCAGAGAESSVAIWAEPSIEALTGSLAVLRAGATVLPLDPRCSPEHAAAVLADAGARLVLGDRSTPAPPEGVTVVGLDERGCACGGCGTPAVPDPRPAQRAYLLYPPGDGDRLAGVELCHGALAGRLVALRAVTGAGPGGTWLACASPASGLAVLELLLPLTAGARVVLAGAREAADAAGLLRLARRHRVTHAQATPAVWLGLLDAGLGSGDGPALSALVLGEPLPAAQARRLRRAVTRLWSLYGSPETALWSAIAEVPPDGGGRAIGTRAAGVRTAVLDGGGDPAPIGLAGELCVGGAGLARGYAGRPALTAERFVPDPYGPPGSRRFRTGDRARRLADGSIVLAGRTDDPVDRHGRRLQVGAVEERLAAHPGVAACAVVAAGETTCVTAYVVPARGRPPDAELREWVAGTLPRHLVPDAWVALDRLPLTLDGRLDRAALAGTSAAAGGRAAEAGPAAAADPVQRELAGIWREVLGVGEIGLEQSIFEFGVNSLTIARIASRIRHRMKVEIPLDTFYDRPTIAGIAAIVAEEATP
jgi:non-ribosomal peptide synthetase component F